MPRRTTILAPGQESPRIPERNDENRETPRGGLVRRLMKSADEGKSFLWIWSLVAGALLALSVASLLARGRPNGLDFSWSG